MLLSLLMKLILVFLSGFRLRIVTPARHGLSETARPCLKALAECIIITDATAAFGVLAQVLLVMAAFLEVLWHVQLLYLLAPVDLVLHLIVVSKANFRGHL